MPTVPTTKAPECALCGDQEDLGSSFNGLICKFCLERSRTGRDRTTQAARASRIADTEQATANMMLATGHDPSAHDVSAQRYAAKAAALLELESVPQIALGEAVPTRRSKISNTLNAPGVAALDASAHRLQLLAHPGLDCTALALDASDSIKAENSLEKMLAHQLAVAHKAAMEITAKATFEPDSIEKARLLKLAVRMMEVFQRGLLVVQRLRTNGDQRITVQYINVADGGQAVVGDMKVGGTRG